MDPIGEHGNPSVLVREPGGRGNAIGSAGTGPPARARCRSIAVLAAIRARHVFIIRADNHAGACGIWGKQLVIAVLELVDKADMGAGEMVNKPIVRQPRRAARSAAAAKRGQALAAWTKLHAVPKHRLRARRFAPIASKWPPGKASSNCQWRGIEPRRQVFRLEQVIAKPVNWRAEATRFQRPRPSVLPTSTPRHPGRLTFFARQTKH